jgi:hypothetical protein
VGYHVALTREAARRQSDARLEEMIRERSLRQTLKLAADYRVPMHFPDRDLAAGVLQKDVGAASACSNRVPAQPWIVAMANGRFTSRSAVRNIAQSATSASRVRRDKGGAFQWVQVPPGQSLQPEATGAVMEVTKWLKPSV